MAKAPAARQAHPSLRAVAAARDALGGHPAADRCVIRALTLRVAGQRGLTGWGGMPPEPWPGTAERCDMAVHLADVDVTGWDMADLGTAREYLLEGGSRKQLGSWYTPPEIAREMCRLAIGPQLERLAKSGDPGDMLRVTAVDPACGAGVFLAEAAKLITRAYCEREFGNTDTEVMAAVMPEVAQECVFGMDIDPVAVDLARFALWLECGGRPDFRWMDRNVCAVDPLSAPDAVPPALAGRDKRWAS